MIQSFQRDFGGASEAGVSTVVFMGVLGGRTEEFTPPAHPIVARSGLRGQLCNPNFTMA